MRGFRAASLSPAASRQYSGKQGCQLRSGVLRCGPMVVFVRPVSGMAPNPMSPPSAIPEFLERHRGKSCPYCGQTYVLVGNRRRTPTRDHIRPRRFGGGPILTCCSGCNNDKGSLFLSEWVEQLSINRDPRALLVRRVALEFPELARRPHDLPLNYIKDPGKRIRRLVAIERKAKERMSTAPAVAESERMPGLERTRQENVIARANGSRTAPWLPCPICRLYFPRQKALDQHTEMKHRSHRPMMVGADGQPTTAY